MGFFFLFVAACSAYGIFRMLRFNAESRRYLEAAQDERPLRLEHLSEPLRGLVRDTRLLRIALESPARDVAEYLQGELNRSHDDVQTFDQMLMNLTRLLTDWLQAVDRLSEVDQARLKDAGASPDSIRAALEAEGWSFERRHLKREGRPPMHTRIEHIMGELNRIEEALQLAPSPYR